MRLPGSSRLSYYTGSSRRFQIDPLDLFENFASIQTQYPSATFRSLGTSDYLGPPASHRAIRAAQLVRSRLALGKLRGDGRPRKSARLHVDVRHPRMAHAQRSDLGELPADRRKEN